MEIITYNCQSISPMFIGNANPKDAELRPGVIKASLRFWWRALHKKLLVTELKQREAELFGGTYLIEKDGKSISEHKRPSFRIISINNNPSIITSCFLDARPEKTDKYGCRTSSKAIKPNSKFSFKIIVLDSSKKEQIQSIIFLASVFGGLGKRARRGAGAWLIENIKYNEEINELPRRRAYEVSKQT